MPSLHLHNHLATGHLDFLFLHPLAAPLHLVDFLLVTGLLCFALLPLFESDASHYLHGFLSLFLVFVLQALLVVFDLLLVLFSLLLHHATLQPLFESLHGFLLFSLLDEPFLLLLLQLVLLFESLSH